MPTNLAREEAVWAALAPIADPDGPVVAESVGADQPFNEDSIVEKLPAKTAEELDKSFIDELEDSLSKEINRDELKAAD